MADTRYRCTLLDPPWAEYGGGGRGAQNHYSVLETSEIAKVILRSSAFRPARDAHLWCWTTDNYLLDALSLIDRLSFRYIRTFVWVKTDDVDDAAALTEADVELGLGQYGRGSHEICLLAVRGGAMVPPPSHRPKSVLFAPTQAHSVKPEKAYTKWFERVSPGPRLEMFARRPRAGWDVWGNEVASCA